MQIWFKQHVISLVMVAQRLRTHWLNSLMICSVIGITVTLPGLMFVGIQFLQQGPSTFKHHAQVTAFLKPNLSANVLQRLINDTQQLPDVIEVRYVSKEEALSALNAQFKEAPIQSEGASNPLPDALYITLSETAPSAIAPLQQSLQHRAEIDELVMDSQWQQQLHDSLGLIQQLVWVLSVLLGAAMVTVISNTVRMQVLTQQAEIEVSRLIGATQSYIRRPFLYLGCAYGLGGGLIAFAGIGGILHRLQQPLQVVMSHFPTALGDSVPWIGVASGVVVVSMAIGWMAAFVALMAPKQA